MSAFHTNVQMMASVERVNKSVLRREYVPLAIFSVQTILVYQEKPSFRIVRLKDAYQSVTF